MTTINEKAAYVRAQTQTRPHTCHWPGCTKQVKPAMWGCITHWRMLPAWLRLKVWNAYNIGQEKTGDVLAEYINVMREVDAWVKANHGR